MGEGWNSDGTKYVLIDGYGNPIIYDNATDTSVLAPLALKSLGQNDLKWSNSDPNLMYVSQNLSLKTYNIQTQALTTLHTFSCTNGVVTGDRVRMGDEGSSSFNNRYWANFCLKNSNGEQLTFNTYDAQTDTLIASKTPTEMCGGACPAVANNQYLNWITVSRSGQYVIAQWTKIVTPVNDSLGHTDVGPFIGAPESSRLTNASIGGTGLLPDVVIPVQE